MLWPKGPPTPSPSDDNGTYGKRVYLDTSVISALFDERAAGSESRRVSSGGTKYILNGVKDREVYLAGFSARIQEKTREPVAGFLLLLLLSKGSVILELLANSASLEIEHR